MYTPVFTLRHLSLDTWFLNNCWPNCVWVGHVQVHLYILLHAIRYQLFVYCTGSTTMCLQCCREIFTITIWMYLTWQSNIRNLMRVACKQMSDYSYKRQAGHDYPPDYQVHWLKMKGAWMNMETFTQFGHYKKLTKICSEFWTVYRSKTKICTKFLY